MEVVGLGRGRALAKAEPGTPPTTIINKPMVFRIAVVIDIIIFFLFLIIVAIFTIAVVAVATRDWCGSLGGISRDK